LTPLFNYSNRKNQESLEKKIIKKSNFITLQKEKKPTAFE